MNSDKASYCDPFFWVPSSWSALGPYSANLAGGVYIIGSPPVEKGIIQLNLALADARA